MRYHLRYHVNKNDSHYVKPPPRTIKSGGPRRTSRTPSMATLFTQSSASPRAQSPLARVPRARILIIEDDVVLNDQLAELLRRNGYLADQCHGGDLGLELASREEHELVLLDVMLPQRDGFSLLEVLRRTSQVPVIMVTASNAEEQRIKGLGKGADDYVAKPFNTTELLLRIEALLRRSYPEQAPPQHGEVVRLEGLEVDRAGQQARAHGRPLELTPTQFSLLWLLLRNRGEVLSKAYLSQSVLKRSLGEHDRGIDMHLSRVRRKLREAGWQGERLQTVHGRGYCLS
jgi:DNA-binding response OmpR family regulator